MALTYNKATRDLDIKGVIELNDKTEINLTSEEIVRYSGSQQLGTCGLPLGSSEAASYTLELHNEDKKYRPSQFDNAKVRMKIGIMTEGEYVYSDMGVWFVDEADAPEQSSTITLSGYDALATKFAREYKDKKSVYPLSIGTLAQTMCTSAGVVLKSRNFLNADVMISKMPSWEKGTTTRDILSYCAICAAGFARINRSGELEIVSYADGNTYEIDANLYQTYTPTGGENFIFNSIEAAVKKKNPDTYSRFAIDKSIPGSATNTIQVDYNPLLKNDIVQDMATELKGISISSGEIVWGGDPAVMCGDFLEITNLKGEHSRIMVTSQDFEFDGGFNVTETCALPTSNTISGETYMFGPTVYDENGNLTATRVSQTDKTVINATAAHFDTLTADDITTDTLMAALVKAVNLTADVIDAKVLAAKSITSDKIDVGSLVADEIAAGEIGALSVNAINAEIEGSLKAGSISANDLSATMAKFSVLSAGSANFDRETVEHLVANLFNLTGEGVIEDVFIHNLKVAYMQVLAATMNSLVMKTKDADGKDVYYELVVTPDGQITTAKVEPSPEEAANGVYMDTKPIIETSMTVEDLNATSIKGVQAVINKIYADLIDVSELFANTAFIGALTTTKIIGDKSITIMAQDIADNKTASDNAQSDADTAGEVAQRAVDAIGDIPQRVEVMPDGTYFKDEDNASVLKITSGSVTIGTVIGEGKGYSQLAANYVQFGKYQMRRTADGGMAFKLGR